MTEAQVLKLRLSLMGRPVRSYTFDKPVVSVGRDPGSDIYVDNPGVSRDHFRFEVTPDGLYQVVDLGSANGTFVNEQMINTCTVRNNDVIRFGKYTLWVGYEKDRRATDGSDRPKGPNAERATMVLTRNELDHLIEVQKDREVDPPSPPSVVMAMPSMSAGAPSVTSSRSSRSASAGFASLLVAFALGVTLGAVATWLLLH